MGGECPVWGPLLFADDVVLLASSDEDLQYALGQFAAECEAAGMRYSTCKHLLEALVGGHGSLLENNGHLEGAWSGSVWTSGQDASWMPSFGGVPGTYNL